MGLRLSSWFVLFTLFTSDLFCLRVPESGDDSYFFLNVPGSLLSRFRRSQDGDLGTGVLMGGTDDPKR